MASYEHREPILPGTAPTDYERYLKTDVLLSLQTPPEKMAHPDELTFQVVHQSSELLMKSGIADIERAHAHITAGEFLPAAALLRRANRMVDYCISLLHVLETLSPYDYHKIRVTLGHGSGLDSPGFLAILAIAPRLGEAFYAQQQKTGVSLEEMYRRHQEFAALHEVAEQMLDFDERMQLFRFHHLKLAQRIIGGSVIGTGGLPMDLLRQRQETFFYKPLWEVRNEITNRVNGEQAPR